MILSLLPEVSRGGAVGRLRQKGDEDLDPFSILPHEDTVTTTYSVRSIYHLMSASFLIARWSRRIGIRESCVENREAYGPTISCISVSDLEIIMYHELYEPVVACWMLFEA